MIVLQESLGITPKVTAFAEEVVTRGFTVVMPSLFGRPEARSTVPESLRSITRICVALPSARSKERRSGLSSSQPAGEKSGARNCVVSCREMTDRGHDSTLGAGCSGHCPNSVVLVVHEQCAVISVLARTAGEVTRA